MSPSVATTVSTPPLAPTVPPESSGNPVAVETPTAQPSPPTKGRMPINIQDEILIPGWVVDHESFRCWARSEDFPRKGRFSFLDGELWVDLSRDQILSHNRPKTHISAILELLVDKLQLGYFFSDRTLLSHPEAHLSTEPDALFFSYETLKSGRIRLIPGTKEGYVELEGTPDMVLEVISPNSVRKDKKKMRTLYHRAGVREYWLVEARQTPPRLDILQHQPQDYVSSPAENGWITSLLFACDFQLNQSNDPLGFPRYSLTMREKPIAPTTP